MEVSRSQEVHSIPLESFMDQSDMGISIMTSQCNDKSAPSITPMSVSLPVVEPVTRTVFPLSQIKKTIAVSSSTQVFFYLIISFLVSIIQSCSTYRLLKSF